jgi:hypothetical protein
MQDSDQSFCSLLSLAAAVHVRVTPSDTCRGTAAFAVLLTSAALEFTTATAAVCIPVLGRSVA